MNTGPDGRVAPVPGAGGGRGSAITGGPPARREGRAVDDVSAVRTSAIPPACYGEPQECADVVAVLAGRPPSGIIGSLVQVDGGLVPGV